MIMKTSKVMSRSDVTRRSHKEHEELERRRLALKMLRDVRALFLPTPLYYSAHRSSCSFLGEDSIGID